MSLNKESKSTLHIIVLLAVFSPISKAMVAAIAGAYSDVGISLALFIVFGILYWFFGIDYFEVHHWFGLEAKEEDIQSNIPKIILHTLVLLTIVSSFLLSVVMLITGAFIEMALLLAICIAFGATYWMYGVDYFDIYHSLGKKNMKNSND